MIASEYLPLVPGGDVVIRSNLKNAFEAVILKLGDSKQRIRSESYELLHTVATLPHIGSAIMSNFLLDKYKLLYTTSPVAIAEILTLLTSLLRESVKSTFANMKLDVMAILTAVVPALENKHVDVRNAAIAAYTAIYEATNGGTESQFGQVDVNGPLNHLKASVREAITKNILHFKKSKLYVTLQPFALCLTNMYVYS
jgi:hypothetical protein